MIAVIFAFNIWFIAVVDEYFWCFFELLCIQIYGIFNSVQNVHLLIVCK